MTLTPSQRASLASALQIMFDGVDEEDVANCLYTAVGKKRAWSVYNALGLRLPMVQLLTIDTNMVFDEIEISGHKYIGDESDMHRDLLRWRSFYRISDKSLIHSMDRLFEYLDELNVLEPVPHAVTEDDT